MRAVEIARVEQGQRGGIMGRARVDRERPARVIGLEQAGQAAPDPALVEVKADQMRNLRVGRVADLGRLQEIGRLALGEVWQVAVEPAEKLLTREDACHE